MNLKFSDRTVAALCVLTVIAMYGLAGTLDASDFESEVARERREWLAHARACQTKYGGLQASAEYEGDRLVCVTRRGEVLR